MNEMEKRCSVPVGVQICIEVEKDVGHENYMGDGKRASLRLRVLACKAYSLCESVDGIRFVVVTRKLWHEHLVCEAFQCKSHNGKSYILFTFVFHRLGARWRLYLYI